MVFKFNTEQAGRMVLGPFRDKSGTRTPGQKDAVYDFVGNANGTLRVGVWECPACQVQVSGTMYYDRPWIYIAGYISRRPDRPTPAAPQAQPHSAGTVGPSVLSGGSGH